MIPALVSALMVFVVSVIILSVFEIVIHKLFKWKSKNYRYGVWLFAILAAIYIYVTSLGR